MSKVDELLRGRVEAVLNTASGSYAAGAEDKVRAAFAKVGLGEAGVTAAAPDEIETVLNEVVHRTDVLVVLGGDGTIRTAASQCGHCKVTLLPLPGGTMNMLPHALYGPGTWEQVLADTLSAPALRPVSAGQVEGEPFYCAAILGAPTLWAEVREAVRHWDLAGALEGAARAVRHAGAEVLTYAFDDGPRGTAEAVAVICPLVSRALDASERGLEAAALQPLSVPAMARLAMHAMLDDWRNDPAVEVVEARRITVSGRARVRAVLDGEPVRLKRKVEVSFVPKAFNALVPASTLES